MFDNRERFFGLFDRAEMRACSHVTGHVETAGQPELTLGDQPGRK
jgi:hypothetical protein